MEKTIQCERISWDQVTDLTYQLALQIRQSGYEPGLVIAIARGGYVPARLLCDFLDVFDLTSIRVEHYTAGVQVTQQARLMMPLACNLEKHKVLLVDDVDDTGDTIKLALEYLLQKKPAQLKVAVLHHKVGSIIVPDFYAETQYEWRWIAYPWAVREDVKSFIAKLDPFPGSTTDILNRLEQEFCMVLTSEELDRICSMDKRYET